MSIIMNKDRRIGWLANLKVGDKVMVRNSYTGLSIESIEVITPSGMLYASSRRFAIDGRNKATGSRLIEWTEEREKTLIEARHRQRLISLLKNLDYKSLSTKQLEGMEAILNENDL